MEQAKAVAKKIRERRISLGLSQGAVAEKVGVTRQAVSLWESGGDKAQSIEALKASNLVALEKALQFNAGELFKLYYAN